MVRSRVLILFTLLLFFCEIFCCDFFSSGSAEAQVPRRRIQKKITIRNIGSQDSQQVGSYGFSSQLTDFLSASTESDFYDTRTLYQLRMLKDEAQPWWDQYDLDPDKTRNVVQRAFAIRSAQSLVPVIKHSDLKESFRAIKAGISDFTNYFRYSVQDQGGSYTISKSHQGDKLAELSLELDFRRGFDPEIHLGENMRLRYDWAKAVSLLEWEINF